MRGLHKKYDYKDMRIPVEQFTAEGGYYPVLPIRCAVFSGGKQPPCLINWV